jgi:hypothetical protein
MQVPFTDDYVSEGFAGCEKRCETLDHAHGSTPPSRARGAGIDAMDDYGEMLLHCTVGHNYEPVAQLLLGRGPDIRKNDALWTYYVRSGVEG